MNGKSSKEWKISTTFPIELFIIIFGRNFLKISKVSFLNHATGFNKEGKSLWKTDGAICKIYSWFFSKNKNTFEASIGLWKLMLS